MGVCAVSGCDRPSYCRGWCTLHYARWRAHGDPTTILTDRGEALITRLLRRVEIDPATGCWLWTGGRGGSRGEYGRMAVSHDVLRPAHVVAYEELVGPLPEGTEPDHLCRRPLCCNPDHLEPVTHRENMHRGTSPVAVNAAKVQCPLGHEYDGTGSRGERTCRQCGVLRQQRYRERKRAGHVSESAVSAAGAR